MFVVLETPLEIAVEKGSSDAESAVLESVNTTASAPTPISVLYFILDVSIAWIYACSSAIMNQIRDLLKAFDKKFL